MIYEFEPLEWEDLVFPAVSSYGKVVQHRHSGQLYLIPLEKKEGKLDRHIDLSPEEKELLSNFDGKKTLKEIQELYREKIDPNLVLSLAEKLLNNDFVIPEVDGEELSEGDKALPPTKNPQLKPDITIEYNPDGYWVLCNRADHKYMQIDDRSHLLLSQLKQRPLSTLVAELEMSREEINELFKQLKMTGMLEGSNVPKPPRKKKTPLELISIRISLFNPDPWLTKHIHLLNWLYTSFFAKILGLFLIASILVAFDFYSEISSDLKELYNNASQLIIPFGLSAGLVVTLHELGHAFTLKHYGEKVPDIGLLLMCFFPAVYTDTTAQYTLSRFQRLLVVGAGVLVQIIIAAIALWLWRLTELKTTSLLLMSSSLFTLAINLNPLAKFDGYYFAVALTGLNNLKARGFNLYKNLFTRKPINETPKDALLLATYAPLSLLYIISVFGWLAISLINKGVANSMIALALFVLWLLYWFFPRFK